MRRVLVIMGATATGKSGLALALAEGGGREIVSADSRQLYRGLCVGTAQPSVAERARVPHHCVDFLAPSERWSARAFAERALALLRRKNRPPALVVGGTGFYLECLWAGLFPAEIPAEQIAALRREFEAADGAALHARLAALDPASAARLHPNDRQRVGRALEVALATGRPLSAHHAAGRAAPKDIVWTRVLLRVERSLLRERIARRLDAMLAGGWLEEVEGLLAAGADPAWPGLQALGYPELVARLAGRLGADEARERILLRTAQFAKRQETWFRNRGRADVVLDPDDPATLFRLRDLLERGGPA